MEGRQLILLRRGGYEHIRYRHRSMLGSLGKQTLDLYSTMGRAR